MRDIVFEKTEGRGRAVNRTILLQKQLSDGFFKKSVMRNFAEFAGKPLCRNLFFNKVKVPRSATSLKASL